LAHGSISSRTNKAVARLSCRHNWPETNVGAGLPREAPRGRRSIYAPLQNPRRSPGSPHPTSTITHDRVKRRTRTGSATSSICRMRSLSSSGYDPEIRQAHLRGHQHAVDPGAHIVVERRDRLPAPVEAAAVPV
jgi:hypothetical protein